MNIAFEISPLITASGTFGDKSGVYRYTYGILTALIRKIKKENKDDKIILFSFAPSLFSYSLNPEIIELIDEKNVFILGYTNKLQVIHHSDDSILEYLSHPIIKFPLKLLNKIFHLREMLIKYNNMRGINAYYKSLEKEFQKQHIDVVYHSETGFIPMKDFKNVITVYDLTTELFRDLHRYETYDLQHRKLRFAKRFCDGVVTISQSTKNDLRAFSNKFKSKPVIVAYPGTEKSMDNTTKSIEDLNKILKIQQNTIKKSEYFLYYGTFEPRKNIVYVLRAFSQLLDEGKIPQHFKLVLIGGNGWGKVRSLVDNFIKENYPIKEQSNFILIEFINDQYLASFIKNAYAVVYPSLYEGFGLPVLESMALGTPVISSNTSSLPEVGGDAVLYVNPKDYNDVKEKILQIIEHPELAKKLAEEGKKQSEKFNWDETANSVYSFLQKL